MPLNLKEYLGKEQNSVSNTLVGDTLYGFTHSKDIPALENNNDTMGLIFFTKPQLNLTEQAIINAPSIVNLLTNNPNSIQRYVRCTLDPRLPYGIEDDLYKQPPLYTPLVDEQSGFISMMSNTIKTLSGWPDIVVPTYTSTAGLRKEQFTMVDGTYEVNDAYELTATFKNFVTEPLPLLLEIWNKVPTYVFEGVMYDYIDLTLSNEFSYNTRIYRFVMDRSGRFITKSAITGAAFPNSNPTAVYFDYDRSKSISDTTDNISVKFKCMGAIYNDDRSLLDFNLVSATFHPGVYNYLTNNDSTMVPIPYELLPLFNFRGYPIVDLDTKELIWLIDTESATYNKIIDELTGNTSETENKE